MKVVMGPFAELAAGLKRSAFFTRDGALVPRTELHLENARIYNIFIFRGDYYVVYETERLDFYKPYLARLPPPGERKEVEELRLPRCPRCGSWDVHVYADEMLCGIFPIGRQFCGHTLPVGRGAAGRGTPIGSCGAGTRKLRELRARKRL